MRDAIPFGVGVLALFVLSTASGCGPNHDGSAERDSGAQVVAEQGAGLPVAPQVPAEPPVVAVLLEEAAEPPAFIEGIGHLGVFHLAWRPLGGHASVPRNLSCALEVLLTRDGVPAPDVALQISGFMPAHGHGLVQFPLVEDLGQGRYRVEGLLLHMRGHWQLRFTLRQQQVMETVTFELEV